MLRVSRAAWLLLPLVAALHGCGYLADRGLDFLDPHRLGTGMGTTIGARAKALGLADTGLMIGVKPRDLSIGWRYGVVAFPGQGGGYVDADQAQIVIATSLVGLDYGKGSYRSARTSAAVLPALLSWVDATPTDVGWEVPDDGDDYRDHSWIWSGDAIERARYQQVHAFDVETEAGLFLYFDVGYSPGELLDFLLGIVLIDIAQDDGRI